MAIVPAGAASGNVVVTVGGLPSNGFPFTVGTPPTITGLSPAAGPVASLINISGANFGSFRGSSTVTFNGVAASTFVGWTSTLIGVLVPAGAASGPVVITVNGVASSGVPFTVAAPPFVMSAAPASGAPGRQVTITGTGFGSARGKGVIWLGSTLGSVVSWSDTQIVATVASNAQTGAAQVWQNGSWSNATILGVNTAAVSSVSPSSGAPGTVVTITGSGLRHVAGKRPSLVGDSLWSCPELDGHAQIVASVAAGSLTGVVRVQQSGTWSKC